LGYDGDYNPAGDAPTPSPEPDGALPPETPEDTPTSEPGETPDGQDEDEPEDEPDDTPLEDDAGADGPRDGARRGGGHWWLLLALAALALVAAAARWVMKRLRLSDPAALCGTVRSYGEAAMILYRANLTVLAHLGQAPMGGETPAAFARRAAEQLKNDDFAAFAMAVSDASYGRQPLKRGDIDAGLRAYEGFRKALGLKESARFMWTRIVHGLGDFERIP